ncbi:hypothetical protein ACROYT_G013908 [Oculina patagonica]
MKTKKRGTKDPSNVVCIKKKIVSQHADLNSTIKKGGHRTQQQTLGIIVASTDKDFYYRPVNTAQMDFIEINRHTYGKMSDNLEERQEDKESSTLTVGEIPSADGSNETPMASYPSSVVADANYDDDDKLLYAVEYTAYIQPSYRFPVAL